ncbi:RNB-domain-containing protein [Phlegmacium glaucopus]|nr:RNB-domain-containing protein [Phlegmacium glaucopus]
MLDVQKTSDTADLELSEELHQGVSYAPGTFIEARRNEIAVQGIVLSEAIIDRQWHVYTLRTNGEVYIHLRADVHFAIPNLISANLAERCGTDPITSSPQELNARVEALKQLREITLAAEQAANGSNVAERQRNIDIYNLVRSREPRKWSKTSVSEVTKMLYSQPTFLTHLGTHKFLMDHSLKYVADQDYLKTQTFNVRPIEDVEEIQTVLRWIMSYREFKNTPGPYKRFIEKARPLLQAYDKDKTRRDSGPMTQAPAKHTWTESDTVILGFLLRSLQLQRSIQTNPYALGRSAILKHLYPGQEVSDSMTHETLIKLGVLAPWQDLLELLPEFDIDLEPEATSPRAIAEKALVERSYSTTSLVAGQVLGPEDFHPSDPLDSVRHDFGNARVFIIDDVGAEELDDGFSLERIPSEPDNHWVHIHIADPAHLLHPGHALCHQARKRGSTLYFLQKSYPLFPTALMHHPTRGLSLGSDARNGLPNKVITFSVKVDGNANILDYTVRAGLIHNIKKATYDSVDRALGVPPAVTGHPFGNIPKTIPGSSISEQDLEDLRVVYRLANDQVQKRFREDRISFTINFAKLTRISPAPNIRSPTMEPSVFNGFPELSYSVSGAAVDDVGSRNMISEMMKLACRVASRFALDHNLPFVRRGTDAIMASTQTAYEEILAQRSPHSYVPLNTNLERIAISPPAAFSLEPKQHHPLGIPEGEGYSRTTSPLRRFEDLVAHWQLHHALLGSKAPSRPPFDADALEKYIPELSAKDLSIRQGHVRNTNFFVLMFLKRWMNATAKGAERPFGDPLASMTAHTISMVQNNFMGSYGCHVHLPELGIKAQLIGLPAGSTLPLSTELRVKAKQVDLGIQRPKLVVELEQGH